MGRNYTRTEVLSAQGGPEGLMRFTIDAAPDFASGQFAMLALPDDSGEPIPRAYSIASPPGQPMEFVVAETPGGALSPRLVRLQAGDPIWLGDKIAGGFTLSTVEAAKALVCIGTGTGVAPFLAILRDPETRKRFERLILVHGVKHQSDLEMSEPHGFERFVAVSREEPPAGGLRGRVTTALEDGRLEQLLGLSIQPADVHVMLCGSPKMVEQMREHLDPRGYKRHRRRVPGRLQSEAF